MKSLAVSLLLAVALAASAYQYFKIESLIDQESAHPTEKIKITIATHDLNTNTILTASDFKIMEVPANQLTGTWNGFPARPIEIIGHQLLIPVAKGKVIMLSHIKRYDISFPQGSPSPPKDEDRGDPVLPLPSAA